MSLADKEWTPVSVYRVIAAFLVSEREGNVQRYFVDAGLISAAEVARLLDAPDIDDPEQNYMRLRMLYRIRSVFFGEFPPDTAWFEAKNLTNAELVELRVVGRCGWDDPDHDQNELLSVAKRSNEVLTVPPAEWKPVALWGHTKAGPFTIVEGNHRLVAYARSQRVDLNIPVLVGLSPNNFSYNLADRPWTLFHDMWK